MPKAERLPVVKALREEGHSNVAIGKALGVSEGQVRLDLKAEELRSATKLGPERTRGLDGKSYPARRDTAECVNAGQARGQIATRADNQHIMSRDKHPTSLAELGVSPQRLHHARKLLAVPAAVSIA
jgi:hypothetical protein